MSRKWRRRLITQGTSRPTAQRKEVGCGRKELLGFFFSSSSSCPETGHVQTILVHMQEKTETPLRIILAISIHMTDLMEKAHLMHVQCALCSWSVREKWYSCGLRDAIFLWDGGNLLPLLGCSFSPLLLACVMLPLWVSYWRFGGGDVIAERSWVQSNL